MLSGIWKHLQRPWVAVISPCIGICHLDTCTGSGTPAEAWIQGMDYQTSSRHSELFNKSVGCPPWSITRADEWVCHGLQWYGEVKSSWPAWFHCHLSCINVRNKISGKNLDLELAKHLFSLKNINNILTLYDKTIYKPFKGFTEPRQS